MQQFAQIGIQNTMNNQLANFHCPIAPFILQQFYSLRENKQLAFYM